MKVGRRFSSQYVDVVVKPQQHVLFGQAEWLALQEDLIPTLVDLPVFTTDVASDLPGDGFLEREEIVVADVELEPAPPQA